MDPALLKEREAFLKRAKSQPTVEKRKAKSGGDETANKKPKQSKPSLPKPQSILSLLIQFNISLVYSLCIWYIHSDTQKGADL